MNATLYEEVASAPGVYQPLLVPPAGTTRARAVELLADACTEHVAITAAIHERDDGPPRFTLIRDPSITEGAPGIEDYQAIGAAFKRDHGWRVVEGGDPMFAVTAMLGLREGYDRDAPVRAPSEVAGFLGLYGAVVLHVTAVHLMSARHLDGAVRIYDEPGVLIVGGTSILPAVARIAATLGQQRFVVTDRVQNCTCALRKR